MLYLGEFMVIISNTYNIVFRSHHILNFQTSWANYLDFLCLYILLAVGDFLMFTSKKLVMPIKKEALTRTIEHLCESLVDL